VSTMAVKIAALSRSTDLWFPGLGVEGVVETVSKLFGDSLRDGDIVVFSEKALSVALGFIYDESRVPLDPLTRAGAELANFVWCDVLNRILKSRTISSVCSFDLELLAKHKRLALAVGGLKHFLKPLSEAGIDASNLPYAYVSLPLPRADKVAEELRWKIRRRTGQAVGVLIVDTDRTFRPRGFYGIAFSTRRSYIRGVVDLGFAAYAIGRLLRRYFIAYPTPVAYSGPDMSLIWILRVAHVGHRALMGGAGGNLAEMLRALGRVNPLEITWRDLAKVKHRPVAIVRLRR